MSDPTDDVQKAIDADIYDERRKQEQIWGAQEHADEWWLAILTEEVGEAAQGVLHEHFGGPATVRYEVVQIAAVAQAWLECIDLRRVGALTERPVADAMSSTSGGIPAQVGTGRSVNAPDIDALADKVQHTLALFRSGWTCGETLTDRAEESWLDAKDSLSSLVAIAKEARDQADGMARAPYGEFSKAVERAERAERERDDARRLADDITYTKGHVAFLRDRVEAREARVAELEETLVETNLRVGTVLMALGFIKRGRTGFHAICERELTEADEIARAAYASPDPKEGT